MAAACAMAAALAAQERPLRVPQGEMKCVYCPRPVYPKLAREAHITGCVRLSVLVDQDGEVSAIRLISGHPFLVKAAMDAVKRWRYLPAYWFGRPVEALTLVDVWFSIDGSPPDSETPVRV